MTDTAPLPRRNLPGLVITGRLESTRTDLTDVKHNSFARAKLHYIDDEGNNRVITAVAFGSAYQTLKQYLKDGPISLFGVMDQNVFRMIKLGNPAIKQVPKAA
jgi:hypothetical protein